MERIVWILDIWLWIYDVIWMIEIKNLVDVRRILLCWFWRSHMTWCIRIFCGYVSLIYQLSKILEYHVYANLLDFILFVVSDTVDYSMTFGLWLDLNKFMIWLELFDGWNIMKWLMLLTFYSVYHDHMLGSFYFIIIY